MKIFFILFNSYVHLNPIIHPLHSRWRTGHLGETLVLEQAIFFFLCQKQIESFSCLMNILGSVKERSDGAEYGARGCCSHIHLFQFLMNWPTNHPFIFVNLQSPILLQWPGADATKGGNSKVTSEALWYQNNTLLKPDS